MLCSVLQLPKAAERIPTMSWCKRLSIRKLGHQNTVGWVGDERKGKWMNLP